MQVYFDTATFSFEGQIVEVDSFGILLYGHNKTEVNLKLKDLQRTSVYMDDRHITSDEKEKFDCTLGILFNTDSGKPIEQVEKVMLAVRRESTDSE